MPHVDQNSASDITMQSHDSLRAEAEQLRRQVGSENMNQSSVIASRRLDEALLRLDLATGRRRQGSSITSTKVKVPQSQSPPRRPVSIDSAPKSDLELDESIARSSSVWLESADEPSTQYRLDAAAAQENHPSIHLRPSPSTAPNRDASQSHSVESEPSIDPRPFIDPESPAQQSTFSQRAERTERPATNSQVANSQVAMKSGTSIGSFADLFTAPIDVMLSTQPKDEQASETQQIVTSVPEAKWKQPVSDTEKAVDETPVASEPVTSEPVADEPIVKTEHAVMESEPAVLAAGPAQPVSHPAKPRTNVHSSEELPLSASQADRVATQSSPIVEEVSPETVSAEGPTVESPAPASGTPLRPFQATWQVDEFVVPSTVDELFLAGSIAEQLASRLAAARTDGLHTIAVTSPKSGEGRSTVAMGMALSVAFSGLRVALVDADPKGVKLATDLQLELENSWIDAIRTDLPLEETAVFSQADSLTLIPLLEHDSELPMNPSELRRLLQQLKESFDLVVVDCGASAVSEVTLCDTALIVRDVHRTKALEVETLAMSLRRKGLQGIGVVENFCPK